LTERLTRDLDTKPPPDRILVIGSLAARQQLEELSHHQPLFDRIPHITRHRACPAVQILGFDHTGKLYPVTGDEVEFDLPSFEQKMKHEGLVRIFEDRNGMLYSSPTHH